MACALTAEISACDAGRGEPSKHAPDLGVSGSPGAFRRCSAHAGHARRDAQRGARLKPLERSIPSPGTGPRNGQRTPTGQHHGEAPRPGTRPISETRRQAARSNCHAQGAAPAWPRLLCYLRHLPHRRRHMPSKAVRRIGLPRLPVPTTRSPQAVHAEPKPDSRSAQLLPTSVPMLSCPRRLRCLYDAPLLCASAEDSRWLGLAHSHLHLHLHPHPRNSSVSATRPVRRILLAHPIRSTEHVASGIWETTGWGRQQV